MFCRKSKLSKPNSFRNRDAGIEKSIKSLQTLKVIVGKTNCLPPLGRAGRKQTPTVTAQFQQSLNQLMETLNQANPFFVRCIKSNTDKIPYHFDDMLVLVQLRYTGMLETVTIRQSGYSVRLSFEEFIQHYRILLPRGLLSSKTDVRHFLDKMNLNRDNYQIGKTKIFMRESEKLALDDMLHQEILRRIITLQRWVRTWITRKRFQQMRQASVVLQTHVRRWLAQQLLIKLKWIKMAHMNLAATVIQKNWRAYSARNAFLRLKAATITFQSYARGFITRRKFHQEWLKRSRPPTHQPLHQQPPAQVPPPQTVGVTKTTTAAIHLNNHHPPYPHTNNPTRQQVLLQHHSSAPHTHTSSFHQHQRPNFAIKNQDCQSSPSDDVFLSKLINQESELEAKMHRIRKNSANTTHEISPNSKLLTTNVSDDLFSNKVKATCQHPEDSEESDRIHGDSEPESLTVENAISSHEESPPPLPPRRQPAPLVIPERPPPTHHTIQPSIQQKQQQIAHQVYPMPLKPPQSSQTQQQLSSSPEQATYGEHHLPPSPTEDLDDKPKLDRRRNRPLRKLSLKRSKSNKITSSTSAEICLTGNDKPANSSHDVEITVSKQPVKEMVSEPCLPSSPSSRGRSGSSDASGFLSSTELTSSASAVSINNNNNQRGPFQKAKKHFRTLITGSKADKKSKENLTNTGSNMDWENTNSAVHEESCNQGISSHQNKAKKSKHSSIYSSLLPTSTVSTAPSSSLTKTTCYSILTKRHNLKTIASLHKSDICANCASPMCQTSPKVKGSNTSMNNGFRCTECSLLFHSSCLTNANTVPCMDKSKLAHYSSSSKAVSGHHNPSRPPRSKLRGKNSKNIFEGLQSATTTSASIATMGKNDALAAVMTSSLSGHPLHGGQSSESSAPISLTHQSSGSSSNTSSWNVTRTTEFIDPKDILITDVTELHYMEIFINNKIVQMEDSKNSSSKESMVDVVFKIALKEFKSNLVSTYSVAAQDGQLHIAYKNLIDHFGQVIMNVCQKENTWKSFPVIMGVNAFRGFLDEFRNLGRRDSIPTEEKQSKSKGGRGRKRGKKKEPREELIFKCDHKFASMMANIPTVCEVCSTLMWLTEKIWVCQGCKFTCHKKCTSKVTVSCRDKSLLQQGRKLFGAPLERLVTDEIRVPVVIDNLITAIELGGLYTEGIYRKSGTTSKINELKSKLEENFEGVDLDSYSVHVLTAVLKSFFREMPNPLLTYQLYDDFLWTTAISDPSERIQAIYSHIAKLPRANYEMLERLIFHLARVAQQEDANRMNANSLAIVFAPCILRTDKLMQMQDKLDDISKQTM